ncbi:VanZ family protein [Herbiconiux sp. A18JL235]|uniref:VanZ family protein n=1 Tax=Herbiconiux sp. A18JL235 TaxID=3152363 RepID=A0AB39BJ40_9MICO
MTKSSAPVLRTVAAVLLVLYGLGVAFVVFWPSPVDSASRSDLLHLIAQLHAQGLPRSIGYQQIEFAANVGMFVPLGILIGLVLGRRWWWLALLICAAASTSIEFVQYLLLPHRFATYRDVVANTFGGALGTVVAGAVYALRR